MQHAAAQRDGQRQASTLLDNLRCLGRQGIGGKAHRHRQQMQSFLIGQQFDNVMRASQRSQQSGIAGGDEGATPRTEDIEIVRVRPPPNIVQNQQDGLFSQQVFQVRPSFGGRLEIAFPSQLAMNAALQFSRIGLRTQGHPNDAVGERLADQAVVCQCRRQNRLADSPHAVNADTRRLAGDDHRPLEVAAKRVPKNEEPILPREVVRRK